MTDLLREWLIHQLGSEVQCLKPDKLCCKFQNGVLIGKLLQNYNCLNSKYLSLLIDRDDKETKKSNFRHLKEWLNSINISLDDDTVNGIICGESSAIFGLLYRLCFTLECPNNLNLIEHAKQVYTSFGSFEFIGVSNTKRKNVLHLPYDDPRCASRKCKITNTLLSSEKSQNKRNLIYDKIDEFECSLSAKLNSWAARGDHSDTR